MLSKITNILNNSISIEEINGTLFCEYKYTQDDEECFTFLITKNCFENTIYLENLNENEIVKIEFSLHYLTLIDYYYYFSDFINKNKYELPPSEFLIYDIDYYGDSENELIKKYKTYISLINSLRNISKHIFNKSGKDYLVIYSEEESVIIPLSYNRQIIEKINIEAVTRTLKIFENDNSKERLLYLNELLLFLKEYNEDDRFLYFISNIQAYINKSTNAYQYYLRDFSYNKLKNELDSKALEYIQKIQSIINDSQTKLIAIPTAFVLACSAFEYGNPLSLTNIALLISTVVFALIIQIFLNNQKSSLKFIQNNIDTYVKSFTNQNIQNVSIDFKLAYEEVKKQKDRLFFVQILLWLMPTLIFCIWLFLLDAKIVVFILFFIFLISQLVIYLISK